MLECYVEEEKISENLFKIPENYTYDKYTIFENVNIKW